MKYLKSIQTNRFLKQILIYLELCSIVIVLCGCEGYQILPLELKGTLYLSDEQSIKEIYYALRNVYYEKLDGYSLMDIRASYSSVYGEQPKYTSVEFVFANYIDDSNEGGNVSVITLGYDMVENKICEAKEYRGAGKAAPCGMYYIPENVFNNFNQKLIIEELKNVQLYKDSKENKEVHIRTVDGSNKSIEDILTDDDLVFIYEIRAESR